MKVICRYSKAKGLNLAAEMNLPFGNEFDYGLKIGKEYTVMGILVAKYSNFFRYLIDEIESPMWAPYRLFTISDPSLPSHWYIKLYDTEKTGGDLITLMGYYELCNDDDYYMQLIEREADATEIYFKRKQEIETNACKQYCTCDLWDSYRNNHNLK